MQNSVYERKQNGEDFFSLPPVTYSLRMIDKKGNVLHTVTRSK